MFRSLLWLIALSAFVLPSFGISMVPAHAMASAEQMASIDCPDHAPPPDCPAEGSAKHAAGTCCPLMAGVVALLMPAVAADTPPPTYVRVTARAHRLTGLLSAQDPPPPRR